MRNKPKIILTINYHKGNEVILLSFPFDKKLMNKVKNMGGFWSATKKSWYINHSNEILKKIYTTFSGDAIIDNSALKLQKNNPIVHYAATNFKKKYIKINSKDLSKEDIKNLHKYVKFLRGKALSESTVRTYYSHILDFLKYLNKKPIEDINNRNVEQFIEDVCVPRMYSISTHRQIIGAVKHFQNLFNLCQIDESKLMLPRKSNFLPTVLSKEEIIALLRNTKNLKHRAILALIYASGLRIGELINLELKDVDLYRYQIFVRNSKGRKDRYVMMAKSLAPVIKNYIATYKPQKYFAESIELGVKYTAGSVRGVLRRSYKAAGITKKVTPHTLRHSYATHLLENGVDLRYIQELLGHSRPETTMIYTHVATKDLLEIESPLDKIVKEVLRSDKSELKLTLSGK